MKIGIGLSEETLQIAEERREVKDKGARERYTPMNAEFKRRARRGKKDFLNGQCIEIEENSRVGKTSDLFKKIGEIKGTFHASSVQSLSHVQLPVTPWTAAFQASLSITNSWSLLKFMCIESMMPSNHLIFCCPLLLPPSIFPSTRVFSKEAVLCIRWPEYWSFSFSISPFNKYSELISFRID